ncbi:methanethiol S-methyltransferase [Phenylobacterium sp.]|uniref:methanethiol S-methyltransferase n=1 Tax=Phenylobacterium sp. TaxID=1871053 RepID=UPI0025E56841|nr:methanethiol S-methyltransferase [Phenylobacterium sp.]
MSRVGAMFYSTVCYVIFSAVSLYAIGFIGGFLTPTMLDGAPGRPLGQALAIDVGLLVVFSLQHSGMARPAFKRWWTRVVPDAAERSTYVLVSSLALAALFVLWQPIGGVIWRVPPGGAWRAMIGVNLGGWGLLIYATFLIDHFDLFGLKQGWRKLTGHAYRAPQFHTPSLYRLVRHPLYIGWLTIFWAGPVMTSAHLLFAAGATVYILVAIQLEERDLVDAFGQIYVEYRETTPMLIPRLGRRRPLLPRTLGGRLGG